MLNFYIKKIKSRLLVIQLNSITFAALFEGKKQ